MKFDIGVATVTEIDGDGFIGVGVDVYGEKNAAVPPLESHFPFGFQSRPDDPDTDGDGNPTLGCSVLYAFEGHQGHAWPMQDPRVQSKLPQLKKGGSVQYCSRGSFTVFDGDTGAQTIYVPYAFSGDTPAKAHSITLDGADGNESISIVHGDGMSIIMTSAGELVLRSDTGGATIMLKGDQITIRAQKVIMQSSVAIGANPVGALPLAAGAASPPCPSLFVSAA